MNIKCFSEEFELEKKKDMLILKFKDKTDTHKIMLLGNDKIRKLKEEVSKIGI